MNEDINAMLDRLDYFEEREVILTRLYSMCEAVIRSIPDIYDQIDKNPQIFSSMSIESTLYLSELLINAYELHKLEADIGKDLKRNDKAIANIKRKIQKAEKA